MIHPQCIIHHLRRLSILVLLLFSSSNVHPSASADSYLTDYEFQAAATRGAAFATQLIQENSGYRNRFERAIVCGQILVAEGDSWFNYPAKTDIVDALGDKYWAVFSNAHHGDTLEDMLYGKYQLAAVYRSLEQLNIHAAQIERFNEQQERTGDDPRNCNHDVARNHHPKAILLSGGGNDVITSQISFLLEHGSSSQNSALNEEIVRGLFRRLNRILVEYIFAVSHVCQMVLMDQQDKDCSNVPIIVHGYDYVRASGEGFGWPGLRLRGPWLKPEFEKKERLGDSDEVIKRLIGEFNYLLCDVAKKVNNLTAVELRRRVVNPIIYVSFRNEVGAMGWADELHPDRRAANHLANKIGKAILDFHHSRNVASDCTMGDIIMGDIWQ